MGATAFGHLVTRRMAELEISQNRLASRLGELPDGRIFDATQIRLIREGRRRLDQELVKRLIDALGLDPYEAWTTAGLAPPGLRPEHLRRLDAELRSEGAAVICGYFQSAAQGLRIGRLIAAEQLAVAA